MAQTHARTSRRWVDHYERRRMPAEEAVAEVRPGDHVWVSLGQRVDPLVAALIGAGTPAELTMLVAPSLDWYVGDVVEQLRVNVAFASPGSREAVNDFRADYVPWWVWGGHKARDEGRPSARPVDVSFIRVSPPDANGWCCFGNTLWDVQSATRAARTVIAMVGDGVPRTFGDSWIHASEIDRFVPVEDEPRPFLVPGEPDDVVRAIAGHVSTLVDDGDTIQFGTGMTTAGIVAAGALDDKNDLGYFGELTVAGTVMLADAGVINGRRLATHPGKFVTTLAGNTPEELAVIDGNPMFEFYGVEYVHHPGNIARNDNMVAVNNALAVDLTGQIVAGQMGAEIWSGTGGQLAFAMGAVLSPGGRSVTVLPSTALGGARSRIVACHPEGQVVTVPRDLADIVVTEHGVAHLLNKSQRERAEALIAIAHPDMRSELRREASRRYGVRAASTAPEAGRSGENLAPTTI